MKEITYEDWIKNPIPRMMWVWNDDENRKRKEKVVYISELDERDKVASVFQEGGEMFTEWYRHCAEIKEETKRPCTKDELVAMLKNQGVPLLKTRDGNLHTVISISNYYGLTDVVTIANKDYNYEELCEQFTLLNGNELWVKE